MGHFCILFTSDFRLEEENLLTRFYVYLVRSKLKAHLKDQQQQQQEKQGKINPAAETEYLVFKM